MPPHPDERSPDGLDPQSEQWWRELASLDEPGRLAPTPPRLEDSRFQRRAARRQRRRGATSRGAAPRESSGPRAARSLLTFFAVLLVAAGAVTITERGWQQAREASFAEGGHLDGGTTIQGTAGTYAFLTTHPGTQEPVTYGPCRTVQVQINSDGEVPGGSQLVLDSMAHVAELSGIELQYSGPTDERPDAWTSRMTGGGLEAYPPVLVSWSDETETPGLEGDVVGLGGSISLRGGGIAKARYMTGSVTLDGPDLAEIYEQENGTAHVRAVILHELGHLVGLGHVAGSGELMSETNHGQLDFGAGDREGLARLGSGDC